MDNFGQIQITKLIQEEMENLKSSLSTLRLEFGIEKIFSERKTTYPELIFTENVVLILYKFFQEMRVEALHL